jgi:prepilin-type N-terminal cleavage/methylation domain-containing protein
MIDFSSNVFISGNPCCELQREVFLRGFFSMVIARWFQAFRLACFQKTSQCGMSMAEVLVSVAVVGVVAALALAPVARVQSEDAGKQTQQMMNRVAAAAYNAQLKYGKSYFTATDSDGNLIYPNGMVSLLGSLDKSVKTTTQNGVTTFYYPGNMTMSVGANIELVNNNDAFTAPAGTTPGQWIKVAFSTDPLNDSGVAVANGNAAYFVMMNNGQGLLSANQFDNTLFPTLSYYDVFRKQDQMALTNNGNGGGGGSGSGGGSGGSGGNVTACANGGNVTNSNGGVVDVLALNNGTVFTDQLCPPSL